MWKLVTSRVADKLPWNAVCRQIAASHSHSGIAAMFDNPKGDHLPTAENNVPMNGETRVPPAISEKIDAKASHDQSIVDFHRFTDIYLGGLWNRLENQLPKHEGVDFEYDVQLTSGCMRLLLPDDGHVTICKDPGAEALKVESNLHEITGEGGDPRDEAAFTLNEEGEFEEDGVVLHTYLEQHLEKHLKVKLDLEPQPGAHDKVYAADPT